MESAQLQEGQLVEPAAGKRGTWLDNPTLLIGLHSLEVLDRTVSIVFPDIIGLIDWTSQRPKTCVDTWAISTSA